MSDDNIPWEWIAEEIELLKAEAAIRDQWRRLKALGYEVPATKIPEDPADDRMAL